MERFTTPERNGKQDEFKHIFQEGIASGGVIEYTLPYPKHEFLAFLEQNADVLFHGSPQKDLRLLQPQQAKDKEGVIHILDKSSFIETLNDDGTSSGEWISSSEVKPLATLNVTPNDFLKYYNVERHSDESFTRSQL